MNAILNSRTSMRPIDVLSPDVVEIAAAHAADVDERSRFPTEALAALKQARALSDAVPREYGGRGFGMQELAAQCSALAHGCSAAAMVLAMHHIQVACIARHSAESPYFQAFLKRIAQEQLLIASVTSEVGTFGDTRSSVAAVERKGERFELNKDATTISYGAHADALLVTCRRNPDAAASDQVLVLVLKDSYKLEQSSSWNTLGMRGTCSPGFMMRSHGAIEQIVPGAFADSSAQTMVPYSHILWAALWQGMPAPQSPVPLIRCAAKPARNRGPCRQPRSSWPKSTPNCSRSGTTGSPWQPNSTPWAPAPTTCRRCWAWAGP